MEVLADEQSDTGSKLQQILVNFKKDSVSRKTEVYLDKRLDLLESNWATFSSTHQKLIPFEDTHSDHPYFKNKYYDEVSKLVMTTRSLLHDARAKLSAAATSTSVPDPTIVLPAAPPTTSTTKTAQDPVKEKTEKASTFRLDYEHDWEYEGTSLELQKMVRKQKALMKTLTHLVQDIEGKMNEDHPKPYYELKISLLSKYEAEMSQNDRIIWENSDEERPFGYEMALYHELDDWAQDTIVILQQQLLSLNSNSTNMNTRVNNGQLKLPKIVLPDFDGNYLKWTQFHDLYDQLIHQQPISNTEKMFYLTSHLTGEARILIQHLPVSSENYEAAWNILNNRYNNKRLLVTALLNKFLTQAASQVESASAIKSLHDTTNECLLGLKNLGISIDSWDPLLVHILIKKFDQNTHALYEQSLEAPRELGSIKRTLEFLETRFQALEALGGTPQGRSREKFNHKQRYQSKPSAFMATSNNACCVVCKQDHPLYNCKSFIAQSPSDRYDIVKKNHLCINCMKSGHSTSKCTSRRCSKCSKKHNTLLHYEQDKSSQTTKSILTSINKVRQHKTNNRTESTSVLHKSPDTSGEPHQEDNHLDQKPSEKRSTILAAHTSEFQRGYVILGTANIVVTNNQGMQVNCRAVLDSGSQLHFISERLVKKLDLMEKPDSVQIQGIGHDKQRSNRRVNVTIQSRTTGFSTRIEAFVLKQITANQPSHVLNTSSWPIPRNIELADPQFYQPGRIDLLIGAEIYFELLSIGQIKLNHNLPTLQNTVFGWIVAGRVQDEAPRQVSCGICSEDEANLDEQMEKFWRIEEVDTTTTKMTTSEAKCEEHFNRTTERNAEGRYIVKLPFIQDPAKLGASHDIALKRLLALERRLEKNPRIKEQYIEFMKEYCHLGHMKEIDFGRVATPHYFIPHHHVIKPDSTTTKLRVVFDASMKTSSNVSLNELLHTGPVIQEELVSILLRFRAPRFVFTADIEKMYRQILIDKDDRRFQQILWRDDQNDPIRCYQLLTVTYGTRPAPYLAVRCLHQLADQCAERYPLGAKTLKQDFYVDDLMTGSNSLSEARIIQEQLNTILQSAGFKLRKWCSNHDALLQNISSDDRALQLIELKETEDYQPKITM